MSSYNKARLNLVSLFSGAGGFDWGFHRTSKFTTLLANELKLVPAETLAQNLNLRLVSAPASPQIGDEPTIVQGDIAEVSFSGLDSFQPDVMIGGPPCQDFSIIKGGVRRGLEVNRGKLYSQFVRALVALQPKVFIFENVPGLLSANGRLAYKIIIEDFTNLTMRWSEIRANLPTDNGGSATEKLGYEILFDDIVDASKVGVPQKRRRIIVIGLRKDLAESLELFQVKQFQSRLDRQMSGKASLMWKYPLTCMEVFEGKTIPELKCEYKDVMRAYESLLNDESLPGAESWKKEVWDRLTLDSLEDYLLSNSIVPASTHEIGKAMLEHENILKKLGYFRRRVQDLKPADNSNVAPAQGNSVSGRMWRIPPGKNNEFVKGTEWEVEGRGLSLIYRRAFPLKPAPTVVAYGGGGTWGYHYERERGILTNRERARLQTFPDDFMFAGRQSEVRAQIGEAVPPLLAERLADVLAENLT